ncbi:MAG TPA: hypothetical protein VMS38_21360 [Pseudorhodoferax sp.]|jgi:hypothetical protein|nr:hypothetical protein [Pseudorhodoferax sp.]
MLVVDTPSWAKPRGTGNYRQKTFGDKHCRTMPLRASALSRGRDMSLPLVDNYPDI